MSNLETRNDSAPMCVACVMCGSCLSGFVLCCRVVLILVLSSFDCVVRCVIHALACAFAFVLCLFLCLVLVIVFSRRLSFLVLVPTTGQGLDKDKERKTRVQRHGTRVRQD